MLDGIGVRNKTADELREVLKGQVRLVMLVVLLAVCVCGGGGGGCLDVGATGNIRVVDSN
jgi:hypothetical protein